MLRTKTAFFGSLLALVGACGDGPLCPADLEVSLQNLSEGAILSTAADTLPNVDGVQFDVVVGSNFTTGDDFLLTVTDAEGQSSESDVVRANSEGGLVFEDVTLPTGLITLRVQGSSAAGCGSAETQVQITVGGSEDCVLSIAEGLLENDFYAPVPVLNASNDSDSQATGFQATLIVETGAGAEVEVLLLDVDTGVESSLGTTTANGEGVASVAADLSDGRKALRASCSIGSGQESSSTTTVQVDTSVPDCQLVTPLQGVTVTPDDDEDLNTAGIQMTWLANVDDGAADDTEGETAVFFRDGAEFPADEPTGSDGIVSASDGEFLSPGTASMRVEIADHAGNLCSSGFDVNVLMEGCPISIDAPTDLVTSDSDNDSGNGLQTDVTVSVGAECIGQPIVVDCGQGESSATALAGATVVSNVTLDPSAEGEGSFDCIARVSHPENFETQDVRTISWDTDAPGVTLSLITPTGLNCGDTLARDEATDADGDLNNGFQIGVAVISPFATSREALVTNADGQVATAAPANGAEVLVTLALGSNNVQGRAFGENGTSGTTGGCSIELQEILVNFTEPVSTGTLNASDGTVANDELSITVCVTSSLAAVDVVVNDGVSDFATTFANGEFCTNNPLTLVEGNHTLTATATEIAGARQGTTSQLVSVDFTAPASPGGFTAQSLDHQSIDASWNDVADAASYEVRFSTQPLSTDPAVFATQGEVSDSPILAESIRIGTLRAGTGYHVGVAAIDGAENRSIPVVTTTEIVPVYDQSGLFAPLGAPDDARFGMRLARGNYNGDAFDDLAIGSVGAGEVHIYYGSTVGLSTEPDVTITGTVLSFGNSIARVDWSGAGDGLAVGDPFANGNDGRIVVYHNDTLSTPGTLLSTVGAGGADLEIVAEGGAGDWFTGGFMGWSLTGGQMDAAGTLDDLAIGVFSGGTAGGKVGVVGDGGVVFVYGDDIDPAETTITLAGDADATDTLGLAVQIVQNPQPTINGSGFGDRLQYVGDTSVGQGVGDVAIAYVDFVEDINQDGTQPTDNIIYLVRGRASPTAGVSYLAIDLNVDLALVNPTSDPTNDFGIGLSGIDLNIDGLRDLAIGAKEDAGFAAGGGGVVWLVDGNQTGTVVLSAPGDYLTRISTASAIGRFGTAIANNAFSASSDIDGDGLEDLAVSGSQTNMYIWYGGTIPSGNTTVSTADYVVIGPDDLDNPGFQYFPSVVPVEWVDDLNGDGLIDIAWSSYRSPFGATPRTGLAEFLFDE